MRLDVGQPVAISSRYDLSPPHLGGGLADRQHGGDDDGPWTSEWWACHESCCPSFCAVLCCPCFALSRIKAAYAIPAGTLMTSFVANVVLIALLNLLQLQRLWLPLVPGATTKNCSFAEYFSDVGLAGEGSIARCSQTVLGDLGGMLQMGSYVWLIVLTGRVRQEYRAKHKLGVSERCGEAEDFVLSCCCQPCAIAQMDRDMRERGARAAHAGGAEDGADLEAGSGGGAGAGGGAGRGGGGGGGGGGGSTQLRGWCDCTCEACAAQFQDPTKSARVGVSPDGRGGDYGSGMRGTIELAGSGVVRFQPGAQPSHGQRHVVQLALEQQQQQQQQLQQLPMQQMPPASSVA